MKNLKPIVILFLLVTAMTSCGKSDEGQREDVNANSKENAKMDFLPEVCEKDIYKLPAPFSAAKLIERAERGKIIAEKTSNSASDPWSQRTLAASVDFYTHPNLSFVKYPQLTEEEFSETYKELVRLSHLMFDAYVAGETEKAIEAAKGYLNATEIAFGTDSEVLLDPLEDLGSIYFSNEDFEDAKAVYLRRIEIVKSRHGQTYETDVHYGKALEPLADLYLATEDYPKAIELYEQKLEIFARHLTPCVDFNAITLQSLSEAYLNEGETQKSEAALLMAVRIYENLDDKDQEKYEQYIEALDALASLYEVDFYFKSQDKSEDFEYIWEKALKVSEQAKGLAIEHLGPEHQYTKNLIAGTGLDIPRP